MKVEELRINDTINGLIIYDKAKPRFNVPEQIEVPLLIPGGTSEYYLGSVNFRGHYYSEIHPYTFDCDAELDLERYIVIRDGERLR